MIKTNEIRRGNFLNCGVDEDDEGNEVPMPGRVLQIFQETIHWTNILNQEDISKGYNSTDARFINPIPLTPEWLERCGLSKRYWNSDKDLKLEIYENKAYIGNNFSTNASIVHNINFVHQLQNLYFALAGEELTIKELP